MTLRSARKVLFVWTMALAASVSSPRSTFAAGEKGPVRDPGVAVGPQYDSTHVYVAPADLDAFVDSFTATFGGTSSRKVVTNVLPVPGSTELRFVLSPVGTLSVFAFQTPIPYPFGQERTGTLVTDLDRAIASARASGAELLVEPFDDPIGRDAVIQWPGGVKMQLYWHFKAPSTPPLRTIPDNRVYLSRDRADAFVNGFLRFSRGKLISDENAEGGEIGRPGQTYRRIRIESRFGRMQVLVTDGHLPYPFGRELTGYQVEDLDAALAKARAAGVRILATPYTAKDRISAILEFPGGYLAEVHSLIAIETPAQVPH
jgi:hypothetical protein